MGRLITQVHGETTTGTFSNLAQHMFKLQQDAMKGEKEIREAWEQIRKTWELFPYIYITKLVGSIIYLNGKLC